MRRSSLLASTLALISTCAALTGCLSTESDDPGAGPEKPPVASGVLSVSVGGTHPLYALKQADGSYVSLDLDHLKPTKVSGSDEAIDWSQASGTPVDVFGEKQADGSVVVDTLQTAEGEATSSSALVTTGARRILAININFDGKGMLGTNKDVLNTLAAAEEQWAGSSFGKLQAQYDVIGPVNMTFGSCGSPDHQRWVTEAKAAAVAAGKNLADYKHFALYGKINCGYGGLGSMGGEITWLAGLAVPVLVHELGHNFGLPHAASRVCKSSTGGIVTMSASCLLPCQEKYDPKPLPSIDTCVYQEYGDPFDTMGGGWWRQYNAGYKLNLGWIPTANAKIITSDQTITLAPASQAVSATQLINVEGPNDIMYQVEFRQPAATDKFTADDPGVNGVLVRAVFTKTPGIPKSFLLDMTPDGDFKNAALGVGKSHTFYGTKVKMTVVSVSSTGAKLQFTGLGTDTGTVDPDSDRVLALHSGKCLGVKWASVANGGLAVQRECSGSSDEYWKFQSAGTNLWTIKNAKSGKCLAVKGASVDRGALIEQRDCANVNHQKWKQYTRADGTWSLISLNGTNKCLTVADGSTVDGAPYIQDTCAGLKNQKFDRQ